MTKVNVELALTLKMSTGGGFNMFKPSISISDIDIDGLCRTNDKFYIATLR